MHWLFSLWKSIVFVIVITVYGKTLVKYALIKVYISGAHAEGKTEKGGKRTAEEESCQRLQNSRVAANKKRTGNDLCETPRMSTNCQMKVEIFWLFLEWGLISWSPFSWFYCGFVLRKRKRKCPKSFRKAKNSFKRRKSVLRLKRKLRRNIRSGCGRRSKKKRRES